MDSGATISIMKDPNLFIPGSLTETSTNYTISGVVTSKKLITSVKGRLRFDLGEALYCPDVPANILSVSTVSASSSYRVFFVETGFHLIFVGADAQFLSSNSLSSSAASVSSKSVRYYFFGLLNGLYISRKDPILIDSNYARTILDRLSAVNSLLAPAMAQANNLQTGSVASNLSSTFLAYSWLNPVHATQYDSFYAHFFNHLIGLDHTCLVSLTSSDQLKLKMVHHLHKALSHISLSNLGNLLDSGVVEFHGLTSKDVKNYLKVYGPCPDCAEGKMVRTPVASDHHGPVLPGSHWHSDIFYVTGVSNPFLLLTDQHTGFIIVKSLISKAISQLKSAFSGVHSKLRSFGRTIKYVYTDSESTFKALEPFLNDLGIQLIISGPDDHSNRAERGIRTVRERLLATLYSLSFKLPVSFVSDLMEFVTQSLNLCSNSNSGPDISARQLLTGETINPAVLEFAFGDVCLFKRPDSGRKHKLCSKVDLGVVLNRDLSSNGVIKVFSLRTKQIIHRRLAVKQELSPETISMVRNVLSGYPQLDLDPLRSELAVPTSASSTPITNISSLSKLKPVYPGYPAMPASVLSDSSTISDLSSSSAVSSNSADSSSTLDSSSSAPDYYDFFNDDPAQMVQNHGRLVEDDLDISAISNSSDLSLEDNFSNDSDSGAININSNHDDDGDDGDDDDDDDVVAAARANDSDDIDEKIDDSHLSDSSSSLISSSSNISPSFPFSSHSEPPPVSSLSSLAPPVHPEGPAAVPFCRRKVGRSFLYLMKWRTNSGSVVLTWKTAAQLAGFYNSNFLKSVLPHEQFDASVVGGRVPALNENIVYLINSANHSSARNQFHHAFNVTIDATLNSEKQLALEAAKEEILSLINFGTFEPIDASLVDSPAIRSKMVNSFMMIKRKVDSQGNFVRMKGRLVANGKHQPFSTFDSTSINSPTVRASTVKLVLNITAFRDYELKTVDIKSAFLRSPIDSEVYVKLNSSILPALLAVAPDYKKYVRNGSIVVRLRKALYGLCQSPLLWHKHLSATLSQIGLSQSINDPCLYYVSDPGKLGFDALITTHVDDLLISTSSTFGMNHIIDALRKVYTDITVSDDGNSMDYLGTNLVRSRSDKSISINQRGLIDMILKDNMVSDGIAVVNPATHKLFDSDASNESLVASNSDVAVAGKIGNLSHSNKIQTSKQFLSILMTINYLALSRPDVLLPISYLCTRVSRPKSDDWKKLYRIMAYLACTRNYFLTLKPSDLQLKCQVDASFAVHSLDMRSHSGILCYFGDMGSYSSGLIHAASNKQKLNTKSSFEAELVALNGGVDEVIYLTRVLNEIGIHQDVIPVFQDNKSTIFCVEHGQSNIKRTKHIDVRLFFIKDRIDRGEIKLVYLPTELMVADALTKPLYGAQFKTLISNMMCNKLGSGDGTGSLLSGTNTSTRL